MRHLCLLLLLAGCSSAPIVQTAALDAFDAERMTDQMAASIAGDPEVLAENQRVGPLRIVVQPVENRMTAEIIPRGRDTLFTARVRMLLARHAPDRFVWVMNRDAFYELRDSETAIDLGPAPESVSPDYALTATFHSLTDEDARRRQLYYLCVFQLTDLSGRTVLWTDRYEVEKVAVKGFLD